MRSVCQNYKMLVVLFAGVSALAGTFDASAQKKVSYEEAWTKCKADVTAHFGAGEGSTAGKYARGGACMKQYGYRLKKSARFN